jgi:tetratricopeptide (TPR) repeat protein
MKRKPQAAPAAPTGSNHSQIAKPAALAAALVLLTLLIYLPVRNFEFVKYDDPDYVTNNPHVRSGLTVDNAVWALTTNHAGNWHPLTWLSHMLDCQLFGLDSGAHHLTNVALHAAGTLLLFLVFWRLTATFWRSAWVALLFALHPLHVESVAWIAERKDVLSSVFFFLAIFCYIRFVERRTAGRYAAVLVSFCLGLMAKSMVITLPFVLLLLDVWPLKRAPKLQFPPGKGWGSLLLEKVPLFALSGAASAITFLAQRHAGAVSGLDSVSVLARIGNACISYVTYLAELVRPAGLAAFYPMPIRIPAVEAVAACGLVVAVSVLVLRAAGSRPYLFTGWFWYLGTLVPVIGVVQIGAQAHADRYTYLPSVGIFLMVSWGLAEVAERHPRAKALIAVLASVSTVACLAATSRQLDYWRNTRALFGHALEVTSGNYIAHNGLGDALRSEGRVREALAQYEAALRLRPWYEPTHVHLSQALLADGHPEAAIREAERALALNPGDPDAYVNLGAALLRLDRFPDAESAYRRAISLDPGDPVAHSGMGLALSEEGQAAEGLPELRQAVEIDPAYADGHYNLGRILGLLGRTTEAIAEFTTTVQLEPSNAEAHFNLGTALGNAQRLDEAIREFRLAIRLKPDYVNAHLNLGRAQLAAGRNGEAAAEFTEVLRLRPDSPDARSGIQEAAGK